MYLTMRGTEKRFSLQAEKEWSPGVHGVEVSRLLKVRRQSIL